MSRRTNQVSFLPLAVVGAALVLFLAPLPAGAREVAGPDDGTVQFVHLGGNEWWVEVEVDAGKRAVDQVFARAGGSLAWHELSWREWGAWAASFHIPAPQQVQFAALVAADEVVSCWFTHPAGWENCAEPPFEAVFTTPGGNEWWVEVFVDGTQPLAGVEARVDEGEWRELDLQGWGAYAASFHVPDGSLVEFLAHSIFGDMVQSARYLWPEGDLLDLSIAFAPKAGNEWWVATWVIAAEPVETVEARADGGAWQALSHIALGVWGASFHVPDGSIVEFRATDETGHARTSKAFLWPDAVPAAAPDAPWPREGSYAHYEVHFAHVGHSETNVNVTLVRNSSTWFAYCKGLQLNHGWPTPIDVFKELAPPAGPVDVQPGQQVEVGTLQVCNPGPVFALEVTGSGVFPVEWNGVLVEIAVWEGAGLDQEASWDQATGLVATWESLGEYDRTGVLLHTNAPATIVT